MVEQGEILRIEGLSFLTIVISKNAYNHEEKVLVCPIIKKEPKATLKIKMDNGWVICDDIHRIDLSVRGFQRKGRVGLGKMMMIIDRVQSLFDCY